MEIDVVKEANKFNSQISIKPYVHEGAKNMGLEVYDMSVHGGVVHEEPIICLEQNGVKRYLTGLYEFAQEIKNLPETEKKAKIKHIRETVILLEKELASNIIDIKDKDFWDKVKIVRPDNYKFWDNLTIRMGNKPVFFSPKTKTSDLIKITAIKEGGFSMIAPSLEAARRAGGKFKFYLDKKEETISFKLEYKKEKNKALAALQKIYDKDQRKLFYMCKVLDHDSAKFKNNSPVDYLYEVLDEVINGNRGSKKKKESPTEFLRVAAFDPETLKLRAIISDSNFYKIIVRRSDGNFYHRMSSALLGKTYSEIMEYMKNPLNDKVLGKIMKEVESYWSHG